MQLHPKPKLVGTTSVISITEVQQWCTSVHLKSDLKCRSLQQHRVSLSAYFGQLNCCPFKITFSLLQKTKIKFLITPFKPCVSKTTQLPSHDAGNRQHSSSLVGSLSVASGVVWRGQYGSLKSFPVPPFNHHHHYCSPPPTLHPSSTRGPPGTAGSPTVPSARPGLI